MKTGFSAATLGATTYGAGVLMIGSTYLGVSKGGVTFDPGREIRQVEFDGLVSPIVGNDRVVGWRPTISGTFLEASDANLAKLEFGVALVGATQPKIITPLPANTYLVKATHYVADARLIVDRGDGTMIAYHFPYGVVASYTYKTNDKGEGEFSVTIEARLDPAGTPLALDVCPYRVETRSAVP